MSNTPARKVASRSRVSAGAATTAAAVTTLARTDIPGVYRNGNGVQVNEAGMPLSWAEIKRLDEERWIRATGDTAPPASPAALLRAAAMDPNLPLDVRLNAAKNAAPYYDMRQPLRVQADAQIGTMDMGVLAQMPLAERQQMLDVLKKLGVEV
jgi:hypothetical protein